MIRHYNPKPEDEQKLVDKQIVWSTESVNTALEMIKMGQSLDRSPFWEGKIDRRKGDLVYHLSDYELQEWVRCAADILYFINNYVKVKTDVGQFTNIKLRKYQLQQVLDFLENDEIILGWSRQSGKTIGTSIYMLWCAIFQPNRHIAILANKSKTSHEVLAKIQDIYKYLPFFLKPGIYGWNTGAMSFDNGSKIFTGSTTVDALNGKTCNILYIDEFAYIGKGKNKVEFQKDFLANQMPILAAQKNSGLCKLIVSSTPVGKEYFYELIDGAMKRKNNFTLSIVKWWQIPGRDVAWARNEISKIGIAKFRQQYEMSFSLTESTLLESATMKRLNKNRIKFEQFDDVFGKWSEYFTVDPNIELTYDDFVCLSVDIAEGLGGDYSCIQVLKLCADEQLAYRQVAKFSCNTIPVEEFAKLVKQMITMFDEDKVKLLVESNTYGDFFFKCYDGFTEYDIGSEVVCMFKRSADATHATRGLRTNSHIKKVAVKAFKTMSDSDILKIYDADTIQQTENFQDNGRGSYEATIGHDDDVTPLINFCYWLSLNDAQSQYWIEDFLEFEGIEYDVEEVDDSDNT